MLMILQSLIDFFNVDDPFNITLPDFQPITHLHQDRTIIGIGEPSVSFPFRASVTISASPSYNRREISILNVY